MAPRRVLDLLLAWTLGLGAVAVVFACADLRWNTSNSLPPGLWRRVNPSFDTASGRGQVVLFCPPNTPVFREAKARGYIPRGRCPGNFAPMIKPAVALPGDRVAVDAGIRVNGVLVTQSERLEADSQGRRMPVPEGGVVPPGEVWVVSSYHARSFDSRYAGAIPISQIRGVMEPFWLWE